MPVHSLLGTVALPEGVEELQLSVAAVYAGMVAETNAAENAAGNDVEKLQGKCYAICCRKTGEECLDVDVWVEVA